MSPLETVRRYSDGWWKQGNVDETEMHRAARITAQAQYYRLFQCAAGGATLGGCIETQGVTPSAWSLNNESSLDETLGNVVVLDFARRNPVALIDSLWTAPCRFGSAQTSTRGSRQRPGTTHARLEIHIECARSLVDRESSTSSAQRSNAHEPAPCDLPGSCASPVPRFCSPTLARSRISDPSLLLRQPVRVPINAPLSNREHRCSVYFVTEEGQYWSCSNPGGRGYR